MNSNIEIEAKVLLSEEQYELLVNYLGLDKYRKVKQTNYYIDSKERILKQNDIALRIREKDDFVLTLKTPLSEGLLEKNQTISWREYEHFEKSNSFPSGDIKLFLEMLGFNPDQLEILATFSTERIEMNIEDGLLSLDKNIYGENIDYEIEVEASSMDRAEEICQRILNEAGIRDFKFNTLSKQSRAMNALKD